MATLDRLEPSLTALSGQLTELHHAVGRLDGALERIGRLAERIPGGARSRR